MAAARVCCRGNAVRDPPVNSRKRRSRCSAICCGLNDLMRAAASSRARGIPSNRVQISATAGPFSSVRWNSGRDAAARSTNNRTASYRASSRADTPLTSDGIVMERIP